MNAIFAIRSRVHLFLSTIEESCFDARCPVAEPEAGVCDCKITTRECGTGTQGVEIGTRASRHDLGLPGEQLNTLRIKMI